MKNIKKGFTIILLLIANFANGQSVEVLTFNENPLEISPLLGGDLSVNFKYTSQSGASANHIYIGLEVLDENNQYISTVSGKTLRDQQAGTDIQKSVSLFVGSILPLSEDLPTGHYYQVLIRLYDTNWVELAVAGYWDTPILNTQNTIGYDFSTKEIAKGADISWMTEMESQGYTWKDNDGNTKELLPLLKEYDLDAVRLRVWVDPSVSGANGWCNINDMVAKAEKAAANNQDILITIHYSDWWADPGKQAKPASWNSMSVAQLEVAIENHTTAILTALSTKGITPKWIQIGNETNDGMLWPSGRASIGGFANYAKFLNAGANAVKAFNSNIKTILHIAGGNNNSLVRWNVDGLIDNGFQTNNFDIIGLSSYPSEEDWKIQVEDTYANMVDLKSRYNKGIMMVEVGFSNSQPVISYQYLTYMIEKTKQAEGLGVFYWEPIARSPFTGYSKGAWDDDGSPSVAMDAFIEKATLSIKNDFILDNSFKIFPNPSSYILQVHSLKGNLEFVEIYDYKGRLIRKFESQKTKMNIAISNLSNGIYIIRINHSKSYQFIKQ